MRNGTHLTAMVCMVLLLFSATVRPAASAPQYSSDIPAPTVRVSTRLVLVDVVVRGKQGQAITDLKADDFVIEENGKKQKIATFVPPSHSQQSPAPTLAAGLYTNRPDFRSPGGPLTVVILDAANAAFQDQAYGRLQMLKFITGQLKVGQRVAIFTLTDRLEMLQDFTSDPAALRAAVEHYRPQEPLVRAAGAPAESAAIGNPDVSPAVSAEMASIAGEIANFQSAEVGYLADIRVRTTLEAMRQLGRALGGLPGRKEVIWLTAAFPFDILPQDQSVSEAEMAEVTQGRQIMAMGTRAAGSMAEHTRNSYSKEISEAAADLSSAQIAIYPIDVRGLTSGMEGSAGVSGARNPFAVSEKALSAMSDLASSQQTMREMASETGGKAYINQNDIEKGVELAFADNAASYTIGYYPENKKWDGRYRHIKVKVARDGAQILNRKGYFATDPTQIKGRKSDQEVAEALRTDVPATQVTFSARAKKNDKGNLGIDFLIDAHTLSTEDASGGNKKFNFSYWAAIFARNGKILSSRSMKVDQAFNPDTYQQILQHGIMLHLDMDSAPALNEELRLVVRDERTGFMGSTVGPLLTQ